MTRITRTTIRPADRREEDTMHLFDADAKEEEALCGAEASVHDLITVQYCLRQLIDDVPVGNVCRICMACAARWAVEHCRKLEADATVLRAKARRLHNRSATRYRNSVEAADLEAAEMEEEIGKCRQLVDSLAR